MSLKGITILALVVALVALAWGKPECQDNTPDYRTVNPEKGCRFYWECKKGELTEGSCLWMVKEFDPVTSTCLWRWKVDCSAKPAPIPTAPPSPTESPALPTSTGTTSA